MAIDGGSLFFSGYDPQRHRCALRGAAAATTAECAKTAAMGSAFLLSNLAASTLLTSPGVVNATDMPRTASSRIPGSYRGRGPTSGANAAFHSCWYAVQIRAQACLMEVS